MKLLEVKTPVKSYLYESIFNKKEISTLTFEQLSVIKQVEDAVLPHIQEYQRQILTEAPISADRIIDPQTGVFALATKTADEKGVNPGFLQKSTKAIGQSLPIQALVAANKALNTLGAKIQDTKPVTGFDTRVEKIKLQWAKSLRKSPGGKKLLLMMDQVGTWGIENPGKQAFALGALMVVAGVLGGPGGAAVSGYLLRSVMDQTKQGATEVPTGTEVESDTGRVYTKGEDGSWTDKATGVILPKSDEGDENFEAWSSLESKARVDTGVGRASTTVGKAAKVAAIGALVGFAADWIGDAIIGNIEMAGIEDIEAMSDALDQAAVNDAMAGVTDQYGGLVSELENAVTVRLDGHVNAFYYSYDIIMPPDTYEAYKAAQEAVKAAGESFSPEWYTEVAKYHDMMAGLQADPDQSGLRAALAAVKEAQKASMSYADMESIIGQYSDLEGLVDNLSSGNTVIAAAAQAGAQQADQLKAAATKAGTPEEPEKPVPSEMIPAEVTPTESIDKDSFMPDLAEDFHNAKLDEDWNSVLSTVKQTGKLLGTKLAKVGSVSLGKLIKAWKKAGSPEDTEAVRMIMSDAGLDAEVIEKAITDGGGLGLEEPGEEPGADDAEAGDAKPGEEPGADDAEAGDAKPGEEPGADDAEADDAETGAGAETGSVEATDEEIAAVVQQIVDSGMYVNGKVTHAGLKDIIGESNKELAKLIAHIEYGKENEMRVDEMCGGGCGDEMEMPKTNYNLSVTKDEGSTHKTMTVTSDQPDELIRVLQLSGMDIGHSEPDGDEIVGVDMDHDEPSSVTSMQDLIAKVSNGNGHDEEHSHGDMTHSHSGGDEDHDHDDEAHEEAIEVEQDPRHSPKTYSIKDLVVGHTKKQPRQRRVAAHHGDNPYKDAGQLEEEYVAAYDAYKNEK